MRLLVDSFSEMTKGYDAQAKTIGEALALLRKKDASHIHFGKLGGGEQTVDLAKYLVLLAKDCLVGKLTWDASLDAKTQKAMKTYDFYTGATDINGVKY